MKKSLIKFKSLLLRNIKLYFTDKLMFFISLLAPLILLLLFVLFLKNNYYNSFVNSLPDDLPLPNQNVPNAFISGWLVASLMSVTCVTVSFGVGTIMVQDKITGTINDLKAAPVKQSVVSLTYYLSTFVSSIIIVFSVLILGFLYLVLIGWYLSLIDVLLICLNTFLLTLFGCGLSTIINSFIKSEGGISAVSALSSSIYGFICGAYLPLAQFGSTFSNIFGFNPGLYSSILFKNLFTRGAIEQMSSLPNQAIEAIKDSFDLNFYMFKLNVHQNLMWIIIIVSIIILTITLVIMANQNHLFMKNKYQNKKSQTIP